MNYNRTTTPSILLHGDPLVSRKILAGENELTISRPAAGRRSGAGRTRPSMGRILTSSAGAGAAVAVASVDMVDKLEDWLWLELEK